MYSTPMDSYDILVIILSVTLAVFLILAIIATSIAIKVLKKIHIAADSAKAVADNVEAITGSVKHVANGTAVISAITMLFEKFKKSGGTKGKSNE